MDVMLFDRNLPRGNRRWSCITLVLIQQLICQPALSDETSRSASNALKSLPLENIQGDSLIAVWRTPIVLNTTVFTGITTKLPARLNDLDQSAKTINSEIIARRLLEAEAGIKILQPNEKNPANSILTIDIDDGCLLNEALDHAIRRPVKQECIPKNPHQNPTSLANFIARYNSLPDRRENDKAQLTLIPWGILITETRESNIIRSSAWIQYPYFIFEQERSWSNSRPTPFIIPRLHGHPLENSATHPTTDSFTNIVERSVEFYGEGAGYGRYVRHEHSAQLAKLINRALLGITGLIGSRSEEIKSTKEIEDNKLKIENIILSAMMEKFKICYVDDDDTIIHGKNILKTLRKKSTAVLKSEFDFQPQQPNKASQEALSNILPHCSSKFKQ
jgi:hypothetical protein